MLDIILNERVLLFIYFLVTPTLSFYILNRRANKLFQFMVTISNHGGGRGVFWTRDFPNGCT